MNFQSDKKLDKQLNQKYFFSLNDLPYFIIEKILNNINDTKTYLTARATCKYWYDYLKIVNIYHRGVIIEKIFFHPKKIQNFYQPEGTLKYDIKFDNFGHYKKTCYSKKNERIIKIIKNNPPNLIELRDYSDPRLIIKKIVDVSKDKVETETIPLFVPGNCLIS
jgi:hypothetical protein